MSRLKDNYESSRAAKFEAWLNGDLDPMDGKMEVYKPETCNASCDNSYQINTEITTSSDMSDAKLDNFFKFMGRFYSFISAFLCVVLICTLLWMVQYLPEFGNADNPVNNEVSERYIESGIEETGATNFVTGMILDYRAFDTFGESCVLFIATICVQILLRLDDDSDNPDTLAQKKKAEKDNKYEPKDDVILQKISCLLIPLIFIFGIYIILNGHLSPGGGFSGGAVMGAGLILYQNAFGYTRARKFFNKKTFRIISLSALIFYCVAKSYSFFTGANHLESHIPLGTPGAILSSGLILPLNICVGLVVACTMYAFYTLFRKGDF